MKTEKKLVPSLILVLLLAACDGAIAAETSVPEPLIPTATLPAFPTPTSTVTLPASQPDGFPYVPLLSAELPQDGLVLAAHSYSDNACYDVAVYQDDTYLVLSCFPGFAYPSPTGILNTNQSTYLHRWMERYQSYETPSASGLLKFLGNGTLIADDAAQISMRRLLGDVEWVAHAYVHAGGWPSAVYAAQRVLAAELGIVTDEITVLKFEVVDFPDACLGAPGPDELCAQVITSGWVVQLIADNFLYEFHTELSGYDIRLFGEPQIAPTPAPQG